MNNSDEGNTQYLSLKSLLQQWKLKHFLQYFIAQNIGVEELKMMKTQHIAEVLRNFTHGDRIRFEYELEKWRYSIGNPLQSGNGMRITEIPTAYSPPACHTTKESKDSETQTQDELSVFQKNNSIPTPSSELLEPSAHQPTQPARFEFKSCRKETSVYSPRVQSPVRAAARRMRGRPSADLLAQQMSIKLDAREILERCRPRGPELMKIFEINKRFRPVERVELINIFAHYFYEHSIHLPVKLSYVLEQQILQLFPGERLRDYRTEKRGKIYIRLSNIKNNRRRAREAKATLYNQSALNKEIEQEEEDCPTLSNSEMSFKMVDEADMVEEDKGDSSNGSDKPLTIFITDVKQEIADDDEFQD